LLIELGQLRYAYADLQNNYSNYQEDVKYIRLGFNDLIDMKNNEINYWHTAYDQENKWYKTFWFGLACGLITSAAVVFAVK